MQEKIIIDGKSFCDRYEMCENGCPLWNDTCFCQIANIDQSEVEITITKKETENPKEKTESDNEQYPQDQENDEFRFFDWDWLIKLAEGLTAGNVKHPGATWKQIPAEEHACRAVRHLVKWLKGDRSEPHLINAGMRVMMAFVTSRERGEE